MTTEFCEITLAFGSGSMRCMHYEGHGGAHKASGYFPKDDEGGTFFTIEWEERKKV